MTAETEHDAAGSVPTPPQGGPHGPASPAEPAPHAPTPQFKAVPKPLPTTSSDGAYTPVPLTRRQGGGGVPRRAIWSFIGRCAKEVAFVALAAIVLSFILKTFLIQSFFIPSESMEDTLLVDDRVMVSKLAPGPFTVHRGDIVVFSDPGGWLGSKQDLPESTGAAAWLHGALQAIGLAPMTDEEFLIKRVVGTGGDTVECRMGLADNNGNGLPDGVMVVNGVQLDETYVKPGEAPCETEFKVVVPDGALWVQGDNRSHSGDSRMHDQAVDLDLVVGVAKIRTWPLNRIAILTNPGDVFRNVPDPGSVPQEGGGQ